MEHRENLEKPGRAEVIAMAAAVCASDGPAYGPIFPDAAVNMGD